MIDTGNALTTTLMIAHLTDPTNAEAWVAFDSRYRPIAFGVARRLGLDPDDADEAAQEAIARFVSALRSGGYQRGRGRLRGFIAGTVRNVVREGSRQRRRSPIRRGHSALGAEAGTPGEVDVMRLWDEEQERAILNSAIEELRSTTKSEPRTVRAFELVAIRAMPAATVAAECDLLVEEVHRIKHRLTARLRTIVDRLTASYVDDA